MNIQEVMEHNRARQTRARALNFRAGEAAFAVLSREEIEKFVSERLTGVRSLKEITEPEKLIFPPLDEAAVTRVLRDNPDTITLLGREVAVEYREGRAPLVRIDFRGEEKLAWLALADAGVLLPGGREVAMCSAVDGYSWHIECPSSQFKVKARECLNQASWARWTDRPDIVLPSAEDDTATIPFITTVYGQCVVTNEPLVAYGTVVWESWYSSWKAVWYQNQTEAEAARDAAAQKLVEKQAEARQRRERAAVEDSARAAVAELNTLTGQTGWYELGYDLRQQVDNRRWASWSHLSSPDLQQWTAETEQLAAEVQAALAAIAQEKTEQADRTARAAELLLELLVTHHATCRTCGEERQWTLADAQTALERGELECCPRCWNENTAGDAIDRGNFSGDTTYHAKREATILWQTLVGDTPAIQMVVYHKHGCWNTEIIVRRDGVIATGEVKTIAAWPSAKPKSKKNIAPPPVTPAVPGTPVDLSQVDLSSLFGGAGNKKKNK